jgi:hypothetical protein
MMAAAITAAGGGVSCNSSSCKRSSERSMPKQMRLHFNHGLWLVMIRTSALAAGAKGWLSLQLNPATSTAQPLLAKPLLAKPLLAKPLLAKPLLAKALLLSIPLVVRQQQQQPCQKSCGTHAKPWSVV